jgi:hypothetical protein
MSANIQNSPEGWRGYKVGGQDKRPVFSSFDALFGPEKKKLDKPNKTIVRGKP